MKISLNMPESPAPETRDLTPEQTAIVYSRHQGNPQNIIARAGSGKTFTVLASAKPGDKIFAYNKAIQEEIAARGGDSTTWHAWCLGQLKRLGWRGKLDAFADTKNCWDFYPANTDEEKLERKKKLKSLGRIIPILKENLVSPQDCAPYLADFGIPYIEPWEVVRAMEKAPGLRDFKISFSDLLVLAYENRDRLEKIPFAWVDEAQDTNPVQLGIAESCFAKASFVGDPCQAIYSFRGAGMGSFDRILSTFAGNQQNTLSYSFRCAGAIIYLAQELVPDIKTMRKEAGSISYLPVAPTEYPEGSALLARTNKELIPVLFDRLSRGKPTSFKDKNFLKDVLDTRIELDFSGESSLREEAQKEKEKRARETLLLKLDCAKLAPAHFWEQAIAAKGGLFLGTIHSAKGLEWDNVFLLDWDWTDPELSLRESQEERNLRYVAITRARNNLTIIRGN
jgi:superfamily I DNA/RNA helicase